MTTIPNRPTTCVACHDRSPSTGSVCETCRETLTAPAGFLPQQITSAFEHGTEDALIDRWGRAHPVSTSTVIGRAPTGAGVTILDAGISRAHARLSRVQGIWRLRDLGSSNGTFVNRGAITECEVRSGDRIDFGSIGFYLVLGLNAAPTQTVPDPPKTPRGLPITFIESTGGGGGIIEIAHVRARLSPCQLELVEILARRMLAEKDQPAPVRGFVRSSELLGTLSWDTSTPVDSHIKQLVRRVRRRLMELGFGDMIEARHGFGYRLRWEPGAGSFRTNSANPS
ncbi:MAG: FHA domain-containing protein [Kofleriaceae bacterium]|nr:FHA domain-containing protein [Kofleriaceae bacterium]